MNRSFLKWQGGKGSIITEIKKYLPTGKRLIEPFVGAGNVFINTDYESYILNDINPDLINAYYFLKANPKAFMTLLAQFFIDGAEQHEYLNNRRIFNNSRRAGKNFTRSVLFVYLNRHCFNGVCRYNQSGLFNVPFGKLKSAYFPDLEMLNFAEKLAKASLHCTDFEKIIGMAGEGDVIYCDPPYIPTSKTANFTTYHTKAFINADHQRLNAALIAAAKRGAYIVLSNSNTPETREVYLDFTFYEVEARRSSAAKAGSRKAVKELIGIYPQKKKTSVSFCLLPHHPDYIPITFSIGDK
ncbi:Dam family site-specific DNA-(adenine-N6)-methyltransferase [Limnobaculum xujianqingii]|uniref:Dam family site-specific DNA-(adenine-N6)-methyltransferase n=1 Tax=Limnobaculum xujianqingii TaxID=2738837 RepID=UPI00112E8F9F|nr:Dam family site-specific DNA-(adenine-N6)-methyltransferase [Limnobaculum xujianqingii]